MSLIISLIPQVLYSFFTIFKKWFFWLLILVVGLLYRKMTASSRYLFKMPGESPWRLTMMSVFFGILGGFLGSIILIFVGISVNEIGGMYLFFTALALMLIQQRFMCFAYAGGLLSLSYLFFGVPQLSVPHVIALVAVLHLIESLLIYLTGSIYPSPVYLSKGKGRVVGGYNLQKFWPLPLIVLFVGFYPDPEIIKGAVSMPSWWPLITPEFTAGRSEIVYSLVAIPALLGYGDIAMTTTPKQKTHLAALELAGYSVVLLVLAILASHYHPVAYVAALFSPLGHELLIYIGQRREKKGEPLYVPTEKGIKLLYVQRGSIFAKIGIKSEDVLLTLNDTQLYCDEDIEEILMEGTNIVRLEYLCKKTGERKKATIECGDLKSLGYISVPTRHAFPYLYFATSMSLLKKWCKK